MSPKLFWDSLPPEDLIASVPEDKFIHYYQLAVEVSENKTTVTPSNNKINLRNDQTGAIDQITITDNPLSRMLMTLAKHFSKTDSAELFLPIVSRICAFRLLIINKKLEKWYERSPDSPNEFCFSEVLLEAAALARLNKNFEFDFIDFERIVEQKLTPPSN